MKPVKDSRGWRFRCDDCGAWCRHVTLQSSGGREYRVVDATPLEAFGPVGVRVDNEPIFAREHVYMLHRCETKVKRIHVSNDLTPPGKRARR